MRTRRVARPLSQILLLAMMMLSRPVFASFTVDLLFAVVPGAGFPLEHLSRTLNAGIFQMNALKAAADCDTVAAAKMSAQISDWENWKARVEADIENGIVRWNNNDETKDKSKEIRKWGFPLKADFKAIGECARERGFGMDVMSLQGALNWTDDRLREYREYLPRLWCDQEVLTWMKANNTEAERIRPLLNDALLSGISAYYEFSPVTRPMYFEYKNLEAMHQDVYDDEGHVFRSAADRCDKTPRPLEVKRRITAEEALQTCDTLGFVRGTTDHSQCALQVITRQ